MNRINLISQSRRQARAHRVRCRWWIVGFVGYTIALASVCMLYSGLDTFTDTGSLNDQLAELDAELATVNAEQAQIRPQLTEQRLVLTAGRSITDQPDWSMLLIYLADELLGDDVVLGGCTLEPLAGEGESVNFQDATMSVTLTGHAKSTSAVSKFVLRLEASGLFNRVVLERTNREPFLDGQAIAFEVLGLMSSAEVKSHE